jgi:hypothetical protein
MTGQAPKWTFFSPRLVAPILVETVREMLRRAVGDEHGKVLAIDADGRRHAFSLGLPPPSGPTKATELPRAASRM